MPDGDIFSRSLGRNWAKAARLWFGGADDDAAVAALTSALANDLRNRSWPEFLGSVHIIADAMEQGCDVVCRRRTLNDLESYRDTLPSDRYEAVRRIANRMLVEFPVVEIGRRPQPTARILESQVATGILAESIVMHVAPASEAARFAWATKMGVPAFSERTLELGLRLRADPGVLDLSRQLMQSVAESGQAIRTPRRQSIRLTQRDLVDLPIG